MKKWVVGVLFFCAAAYGATQWGNLLVKGTLTVDGQSNLAGVNFATATNSVRLLLPTETTTNLDALTDVAGLIAYDTTQSKVVYNNGSAWTAVGSGSGGTNNQTEFITNGTFENDSAGGAPTGWAKYADAAATSPVDCTGGSPNITFLATSTSGEVIRGTKSGELVKGAANRQGEGISYDFTIDPKDYGTLSPVYLSADYNNTSGYASSDVKVFVYDKDAATLLTVQDVSGLSGALPSSTGGTKWTGVFYPTSTTSNDYRLCFHISSTSATAYDFHLDSVHAGGLDQIPGYIGTNEESYVPTIGATTTPPTKGTVAFDGAQWWREGQNLFLKYTFSQTGAGSAGSGTYLIPLPSGYTIDTTNYVINSTNASTSVGHGWFWNGSTVFDVNVAIRDSSNLFAELQSASADYAPWGSASGSLGNATVFMSFTAKVKLANAQASAALSANEMLLSTVKYTGTFSQTVNNTTPSITLTDTQDAFNVVSSSTFTAPKTGRYRISFSLRTGSATWSAGNAVEVYYVLNGGGNSAIGRTNPPAYTGVAQVLGGGELTLTKGDTVVFKAYSDQSQTSAGTIDISEVPDFTILSQFNTVDRQYSMTCSGPSGWSTVNCKGLPYLTADGAWRLKFNISGTKTSGNNAQISITGVTFKNGYRQSVSCNDDSGGSAPANCFAESNTAYIQLSFASSQTSVTASGDVELNSKPTFVP